MVTTGAVARADVPPVLTERQQRVLAMITAYIRDTGFPPSCADIREAIGFKSPNSVTHVLKKLQLLGAIERTPNIARGIRVVSTDI